MFQRVLRTQFNPLHVTQTGTERSGKAFLETIHFESQGELGRVSQKKRQGRGRIFLSEGRVRAEGWVHERATDLVGAECRWGRYYTNLLMASLADYLLSSKTPYPEHNPF